TPTQEKAPPESGGSRVGAPADSRARRHRTARRRPGPCPAPRPPRDLRAAPGPLHRPAEAAPEWPAENCPSPDGAMSPHLLAGGARLRVERAPEQAEGRPTCAENADVPPRHDSRH